VRVELLEQVEEVIGIVWSHRPGQLVPTGSTGRSSVTRRRVGCWSPRSTASMACRSRSGRWALGADPAVTVDGTGREELPMRVSYLATTPAIVCQPSDTLRTVAALMADRQVGSVVVVHDGTLAGIVTDRDIVVRGVAEGLSADVAVERVMTRNVASVPIGADVIEAATTMGRRKVRRLPAVDVHGCVHGVISLDDVARHLGHQVDDLAELLLARKPTPG
jgi:CBS domain-containing protein